MRQPKGTSAESLYQKDIPRQKEGTACEKAEARESWAFRTECA